MGVKKGEIGNGLVVGEGQFRWLIVAGRGLIERQ